MSFVRAWENFVRGFYLVGLINLAIVLPAAILTTYDTRPRSVTVWYITLCACAAVFSIISRSIYEEKIKARRRRDGES